MCDEFGEASDGRKYSEHVALGWWVLSGQGTFTGNKDWVSGMIMMSRDEWVLLVVADWSSFVSPELGVVSGELRVGIRIQQARDNYESEYESGYQRIE
jgi:hypothetical protein